MTDFGGNNYTDFQNEILSINYRQFIIIIEAIVQSLDQTECYRGKPFEYPRKLMTQIQQILFYYKIHSSSALNKDQNEVLVEFSSSICIKKIWTLLTPYIMIFMIYGPYNDLCHITMSHS